MFSGSECTASGLRTRLSAIEMSQQPGSSSVRRDTSCLPYCNSYRQLEKEHQAHTALKEQHTQCLNEMQVRSNSLMCILWGLCV